MFYPPGGRKIHKAKHLRTYLLNPEGFRHAPFSRGGCLLFVKLRQYAGADRLHVCASTKEITWTPGPEAGREHKLLYAQDGYLETVEIERWSPGARSAERRYDHGVEYFVLEGRFADENGIYRRGMWLRLPLASRHRASTSEGCVVYVKRAGLPSLQPG